MTFSARRRRRGSLVYLLFASLPLHAATVDGQPSFDPSTDTGLYVWRTWSGDWQARVLAGAGDQAASGTFETSGTVTQASRVALEREDQLTISSPGTARFDLSTRRWTLDGMAIASDADDVCLRLNGSLPIYLGRNATPASAPVDLTGTGACGGSEPAQSGLTVHRASKLDWQIRLEDDTAAASFQGVFEFTDPLVSVEQDSVEANDRVWQPADDELAVQLAAWPGWYDAVNFTAQEFSGICLRSSSGTEQSVTLTSPGAPPLEAVTPVDLTNNGACGLPASPFPPPAFGRKFNPGHYVVLTPLDDEETLAQSLVPGVVGFMQRYSWRELEPSQGHYDFSAIEADLATAAAHGIQLVVLIEDKSFKNVLPTPDYLRNKTAANVAGGYTVVRWDPYVIERYQALVDELGAQFDGNARFEGIATAESAIGLDGDTRAAFDYTPEKYREALVQMLTGASRSLPTSRVFWFMNFLAEGNYYLGDIARRVAPYGVVMGGPDVLPDDTPLQMHAYPFYDGAVGNMPLFTQVEQQCYHHLHADTSSPTKYWTPEELFHFGRDELHVSYLFWVRWRWKPDPESYNWLDAIEVIEQYPTFNR